MTGYQLRIRLLSDMCVSDGGVYNSALDTDICHDKYGFPYIPAKRLRGCLRECALELQQWGREIQVDTLFGKGGDHENGSCGAALRIGNAYPEGYESMISEVAARMTAGSVIFHPQNVLNHYSYIRTQTGINYKTGVAEDTSLRTMRVARKGLVFLADIGMPEDGSIQKQLEECCAIFSHIGIARTRGLGEIRVTLEKKAPARDSERAEHGRLLEEADYLAYTITLEEALICKSVNGGEAGTLDYIEGIKVLGLAGQAIKESGGDFVGLMDMGELFCSNAYLAEHGKRLTEVPSTIYSIKNNKSDYVDKAYENLEPEDAGRDPAVQLGPMKHCYTWTDNDGGLLCRSVRIEERYHHRRPEDKSIGRAQENAGADSHFYQISSIEAGQTFAGYIHGTPEQIAGIYEALSHKSICYMGYGRSSEYGRVRFRITETKRTSPEERKYRNFQVRLLSPAVIYNENAMYSTNTEDLVAEVDAVLGIERQKGDEVRKFVSYTTEGGYNVTWSARKPVIEAFDKGSVLIYHLGREVSAVLPPVLYVGERVREGYGEIEIRELEEGCERYRGKLLPGKDCPAGNTDMTGPVSGLLEAICDDLFRRYIRIRASEQVRLLENSKKLSREMKPTVSNMILMCGESAGLEEVEETVEKRYADRITGNKAKKYKEAKKILSVCRNQAENLPEEFKKRYGREADTYRADRFDYRLDYLAAYLTELKYKIRMGEQEGGTDR